MASDLVSALAGRPGLLADVRGQFSGKNWASQMGKALGVDKRTAQRYYTSGKERRAPSPAVKQKMAVLTARPMTIRIVGVFAISNDKRKNPRGVNFHLPDEDSARQFNSELLAGGESAALAYLYQLNSFEPDSVSNPEFSIQ